MNDQRENMNEKDVENEYALCIMIANMTQKEILIERQDIKDLSK